MCIRRSPPVLFSVLSFREFFAHARAHARDQKKGMSTMFTSVRYPGYSPGSSLNGQQCAEDGRMHDQHAGRREREKGCPLCATGPYHRRYTVSYPVCIRSLLPFCPERRKGSAQNDLPTITPLGAGSSARGSHPWVIAKQSHTGCHSHTQTGRDGDTEPRASGGCPGGPRSGRFTLGEKAVSTPYVPGWYGGVVPPPFSPPNSETGDEGRGRGLLS